MDKGFNCLAAKVTVEVHCDGGLPFSSNLLLPCKIQGEHDQITLLNLFVILELQLAKKCQFCQEIWLKIGYCAYRQVKEFPEVSVLVKNGRRIGAFLHGMLSTFGLKYSLIVRSHSVFSYLLVVVIQIWKLIKLHFLHLCFRTRCIRVRIRHNVRSRGWNSYMRRRGHNFC